MGRFPKRPPSRYLQKARRVHPLVFDPIEIGENTRIRANRNVIVDGDYVRIRYNAGDGIRTFKLPKTVIFGSADKILADMPAIIIK